MMFIVPMTTSNHLPAEPPAVSVKAAARASAATADSSFGAWRLVAQAGMGAGSTSSGAPSTGSMGGGVNEPSGTAAPGSPSTGMPGSTSGTTGYGPRNSGAMGAAGASGTSSYGTGSSAPSSPSQTSPSTTTPGSSGTSTTAPGSSGTSTTPGNLAPGSPASGASNTR